MPIYKIPFLENHLTRSSAAGQWEEFFLSAAASVFFLPARTRTHIHLDTPCIRVLLLGRFVLVRMGATNSR